MSTAKFTRHDAVSRMDRFFAEDVARFKEKLAELEQQIDPEAVPVRDDDFFLRIHEVFLPSIAACRNLESELVDYPELIDAARKRFQRETDHWFLQSWLAHRSRTKPTGFPGDYAMLLKLYERATPKTGFGGYLDLWLADVPLAKAVRTRLIAVRAFLLQELKQRSGHVRILNVACGPCREFLDWPSGLRDDRVEVVALDSDPHALDYLKHHVVDRVAPAIDLKPVRYNALRTRSAEMNRKRFGTFDIIYSVGLCDYLSDGHLEGMLSAWRNTLRDGGVMYVAFKDCLRYDKTPYQWHFDWFFLQRTEQDVRDLYARSGFDPDRLEMTRDEGGIIMNFIDRSGPERMVRFDEGHEKVRRSGSPAGDRVDQAADGD